MPRQADEARPKRPSAQAAFAELTKEIARRNDLTQKEARKLRTAREREQVRRLRAEDLR